MPGQAIPGKRLWQVKTHPDDEPMRNLSRARKVWSTIHEKTTRWSVGHPGCGQKLSICLSIFSRTLSHVCRPSPNPARLLGA